MITLSVRTTEVENSGEQGKTQQETAEIVGVARNTISDWDKEEVTTNMQLHIGSQNPPAESQKPDKRKKTKKEQDAEISENLHRQELTTLERAEQTAAWKAAFLAKHPQAGHGKTQGKGQGKGKASIKNDNLSPLMGEMEKATGKDARTVQRDCRIAENIPQDVRSATPPQSFSIGFGGTKPKPSLLICFSYDVFQAGKNNIAESRAMLLRPAIAAFQEPIEKQIRFPARIENIALFVGVSALMPCEDVKHPVLSHIRRRGGYETYFVPIASDPHIFLRGSFGLAGHP